MRLPHCCYRRNNWQGGGFRLRTLCSGLFSGEGVTVTQVHTKARTVNARKQQNPYRL